MKKGALTAVILFVLVVGILGAVLLYGGTSNTTGATQIDVEQTNNDGDCFCVARCTSSSVKPNVLVKTTELACHCLTTDKNDPCAGTCESFADDVQTQNAGYTCTPLKSNTKCTRDPQCDRLITICHCPDEEECRNLEIPAVALPAHIPGSPDKSHPPHKDTLGPCETTTTTATTSTTVPPSSTTTVTQPPSTTSTTEQPSTTTTTQPPATTTTTESPSTTSTTQPPVTTTTQPPSTTTTT